MKFLKHFKKMVKVWSRDLNKQIDSAEKSIKNFLNEEGAALIEPKAAKKKPKRAAKKPKKAKKLKAKKK